MKHLEIIINDDTKIWIDERLIPKDGIVRRVERWDWNAGYPKIIWQNRADQYRDLRSKMWEIRCTYAIHFPDGTYYIGHTKNPFRRILVHRSLNEPTGIKLKQYKICRFDMLGDYGDERDWIERFIDSPKCLNKIL